MVALAILVSGVLWFKEFSLGENYNELHVKFQNTSGLKNGDPVEVRGVPSGTVKDISYESGHALVTLRVERGVGLYEGFRIVIESVGIMGQKMVAVYPGNLEGEAIMANDVLEGHYQAGIPELMDGVAKTLDTFERMAARLETLLDSFDETEQGALTRIVNNLDAISADLASVLYETKGTFAVSLDNFSNAMASIHEALDGHEEDLGSTLQSAEESMVKLNETLTHADASLKSLSGILAKIESGEGSVGMALQDSTLYFDLRNTIRETQALITDIKADPRRYFKFSVF